MARVAVDTPLAHLDRPFDYLVPAGLDADVVVGSRVRVRFSGQLLDGIVLARAAGSEHAGVLSFVERSVSAEPVLSLEIGRLARAVADRYAGTLSDVLRLALPPRHARVEAEPVPPPVPGEAGPAMPGGAQPAGSGRAERAASGQGQPAVPGGAESASPAAGGLDGRAGPAAASAAAPGLDAAPVAGRGQPAVSPATGGWARYPAGPAFLRAVAAGRPARAVWSALPGEDWPTRLAEAVEAAAGGGRGAVVVVPDHRDLSRVDAALAGRLGLGRHVALSADLGPAVRYRRWLAVRRGLVPVAAGTRAAAFAPVADVGLLVLWDDGDDLHAEPRAPYPHTRDLLVLRAHLTGAAVLLGGFARTAEAQQLVETGWAHEIVAARPTVRAAMPRVVAAGDDAELARDPAARTARLPTLAWRTARDALADGAPVLVQVPRRGYLPALACAGCRAPARCATCAGPLAATSGHAIPACRWCGRPAGGWRCPQCDGGRFRAVVVGAGRTAEELGRAFPGASVRISGAAAGGGGAAPERPATDTDRGRPDLAATAAGTSPPTVLETVPAEPALVVATPGAEPVAVGGYGAALLLDGWSLLTRPHLRAAEEALRRWVNAAALVRPAAEGGRVVVGADGGLPVVQALLRWDTGWHAARELAERTDLGFPPARRFASLTGGTTAVADLVAVARLPASAELLGPVPARPITIDGGPAERLLVRVARADGAALARALHDAAGVRSARKAADPVRIQLDPDELF